MEKKLTRNTKNQMVTGVCAGLGDYFEVDPTLIRLGFALATLTGVLGGISIPLYIILAIVMPERPLTDSDMVEHSIKALDRESPEQRTMYETPITPPADKVRNNDGL